ncbi:MAG: nucleotidyl transferase AbiEii/AbiGii toxin family protein, partial [Proteobacteria bacterium]|nr:nucleotidyl transferase AbiEii/AbiGii toxin family protein [Pseudomonadota bacterium]
MRIEKDFKEFIELLNKNEVRYLVVGGYAFSFHAEPRFTKDMDFFIEISDENSSRLMRALSEFGFGDVGLNEVDFMTQGRIV